MQDEKAGDDRSRVGGPENALLGGSDLSTMIGPSTGADGLDADGKALCTNRSTSDRVLIKAFSTISTMADTINLTKMISDRAKEFFEMVLDGHSLKGKSHEAIASACLYIACRQEADLPCTFKVRFQALLKTIFKKPLAWSLTKYSFSQWSGGSNGLCWSNKKFKGLL